jgi:hypothetical protein
VVEGELHQASGRLEEMKTTARRLADELQPSSSRKMLQIAGASLVESWSVPGTDTRFPSEIVSDAFIRTVQEQTEALRGRMDLLAHKLHESLRSAAQVLELSDVPQAEEFAGALRELPAFDPGRLTFRFRRPRLVALLGRRLAESVVTQQLTGLIGVHPARALSTYRALLSDWSERTLGQVQRRFDAYANSYRAQLEGLLGNRDLETGQDEDILRRDLEVLQSTVGETRLAS